MNQATVENTEIVSLLQPILSDGFQGLPKALESIINLAMQFERERHLQAARYERTQTRDGFANGFKPKTLKTSVGSGPTISRRISIGRSSEGPT